LAGKLKDLLDMRIQIILVIWKVVLQPVVALSTNEAEYMAIAKECNELIWLKGLYVELCGVDSCINLFSDSQSAIYLTKDHVPCQDKAH
jgi:hypothetical protein